ncbi:MAG: ABC transporter ATP-binding protein, partial [Candidatus Dormibacteraeota bacterium]|nr:ABC transporter ATP-binding protein [Candidatus Dormibacteraeota bacterium]
DALATLLTARGAEVIRVETDTLRVTGVTTDAVGDLARAHGFTVQELSAQQVSLEQAYMELTKDSVDYRQAEDAYVAAAKGGPS